MNSRLIIADRYISSSTSLLKWFRSKTAKEIYRCGKDIIITVSVYKSFNFTVLKIFEELSKSLIYRIISKISENVLGYSSGIGFVRHLYKVVRPGKLKETARLIYNVGCYQ